MPVIVLVADGVRPDVFAAAIDGGNLPALQRLREKGGMATITSCAPSVTGPAYAPFLVGRYPADVGLPGLRWYDRTRRVARLPGHSRSYVGFEMASVDSDLDPAAPTIFELEPRSLGALSVIRRGLSSRARIGAGAGFAIRTGLTHFRGDVSGWLDLDRQVASELVDRIARERPRYVFAAFTGPDKTSHAEGHESPRVLEALGIVDSAAAAIRESAERGGWWPATHLWVVSDHGHSPVSAHEDLTQRVRESGFAPRAHPWAYFARGNVGVMVSGNAMAHLYLDLESRTRQWWPNLRARYGGLVDMLSQLSSVDLMALALSPTEVEVRARGRGRAILASDGITYRYEPRDGDPLGIGPASGLSDSDAWEITSASDYPDSIVQIFRLATAPRAGDLVMSAARGWDLRARYEPIPHVSSHGALHSEHMLVPLLSNRPFVRTPRRTVDCFRSTAAALGIESPGAAEGESFL